MLASTLEHPDTVEYVILLELKDITQTLDLETMMDVWAMTMIYIKIDKMRCACQSAFQVLPYCTELLLC
jgi:hypothetical protein